MKKGYDETMLFNGFDKPPVPDTPEGRAICDESKRLSQIEIRKDLMNIAEIKSRMYGTDVLEQYQHEAKWLEEIKFI